MLLKVDENWYARKRNAVSGGWTTRPVLYFLTATAIGVTQGKAAIMAEILPVVKEDGKLVIWTGAEIVDKSSDG